MRTVTFAINISLDGYCDHTIFNPGKEVHEYFTGLLNEADLVFFGRVMYELMFPYWADVAGERSGADYENRFAERLTAIDKVVLSRTLASAPHNTRVVSGDAADQLLKLKQQPGGKILVDSVSLLPELIAAGLIDEFQLVILPVIAGKGRPLLKEGSLHEILNLKLVNSVTFNNGCIALRYIKV